VTLPAQILISLLLGLGAGLFFGELVAPIKIVGDAFVLLLQMTVLPYLAVSLVTGLGGLKGEGAATLAIRAGAITLVLWTLAFTVILLIPLGFPNWESASFYSTNLSAPDAGFDFLALFIPSNPFHSLSSAIVPSVVVFSGALGIALIGMDERKQQLVDVLETLQDALSRITTAVVRLAPIGVFAIATNAAGTLSLSQATSLQVYMSLYALSALVLSLWTLPGLIAALTPYRWRDVIWPMRGVLLTAFATGNLFVVLSMLTVRAKDIVQQADESNAGAEEYVDVVVPVSFTFPSVGKLLSLSFVLFAGWLAGYAIPVGQYPSFVLAGLSSYFGAPVVAIPFLLDLYQIPSDVFQLFLVADNVVGSRFGAMLGGVHLISVSLLSCAAMAGHLRFKPVALARWAIVTVILTAGVIGGVRFGFDAIGHEYEGYSRFVSMQPRLKTPWPKVHDTLPEPGTSEEAAGAALDRIIARGVIRVGYARDRLPWAFRNEDGRLVGFDIEMAHELARELGVRPEFYMVERHELARHLNSGALDIVMSGVVVSTNLLTEVSVSKSYINETLAFVVRDHDRDKYSSRKAIQSLGAPKIAVMDSPYYIEKLRRYAPRAALEVIATPRDFFRAERGRYDALLYTAESGSAFSLVYPQFTVAVPQPDILKVPLAYAVRRGDARMVDFVSTWIELKHRDRLIEELYAHYVLGTATEDGKPRWSVIHDVLGWTGEQKDAPEADAAKQAPKPVAESDPDPQPEAAAGSGDASKPGDVDPSEPVTAPVHDRSDGDPSADDGVTKPGDGAS
jgi:Na+/H+-dicarboxylate symporter